MVIVAVSHGFTCDKPFTQTYSVRPQDMPVYSVEKILEYLDTKTNIETCHIDELLVVSDDAVQAHYTSDDINEVFEEINEEELEDLDNVA